MGGSWVRSNRTVGLALAITAAATFGTAGSFATSLIDAGWTPTAIVIARVSIAALILAIPTAIAMRGHWHRVRPAAGSLAVYGIGAVAGAQVCFFNAVKYVPVGVALLLEYLGIVLVVGWMWLIHRQPPGRLTLIGLVVVLVGLAFVLDLFGGATINLPGVLWGLGAAFGLAAYFVLSARSGESELVPPIALAGLGLAIGAVTLIVIGAAGVLPVHAHFGNVTFVAHRMSWLVPVLGLSVIAASIAYVAGIHAARRLGPKLSSFVGLTEVLFAVLFAWWLLGQLPTLGQGAGGVLIIAGIVLVRLDEAEPVADQQPSLVLEPAA